MKNLLSENMLRFGTKNLSEAAQKELTLKSILETIDQYGLQKEVRKALTEEFTPNQVLKFDAVTGYKSALFPELQYKLNGLTYLFNFSGTNQLANLVGMSTNSANIHGSTAGGRFQGYQSEYNPNDISGRSATMAEIPRATKTRAEVELAVSKSVIGGANKNATKIPAGGTYKTKDGKTVKWGRPGFTAAQEMTDAICKVLNITA